MNYLRKTPPTILILSFFAITFILFSLFPVRLDFSKGKAYTLSQATKNVIQKNNKNVDINLYVSSDLPTRIIPLRTDVIELLQEYRRGGKNIKVNTIDPKKDAKIIEKLKELGIPELQFSQLEQNKYQTSSFYFGIALSYSDKNEIIPQVNDYQNLEYNITSAIYRLTRTDMPKIAIVGENQNAYSQQDPISSLKKVLSQQYTVSSLDLSTIKSEDAQKFITDYSAVLLLDNGSNKYSSEQVELLKKFFESGKNVLVLAGGTKIDEQSLGVTQAENNLNELTASYGAQINHDLVLSTSAEYVNFGNANSQFLAPYPFWIRSNLFESKSGLFANIQFMTFPWTSSLSIKRDSSITPLIVSSDKSWVQKDGSFSLNPNTIPQPNIKDVKQFVLGALIKNKKGGEMVVIPSSRFPYEQYMSRGSGNLDFILNVMDTFGSNGVLNGIRSRVVSFYPLQDLSDSQKDMYKYSAILLFPIIWGIYGAIRLMKRK
ncbi:MAG: GldG family protein [Candidatus Roizmanbacteria bacterium]|nr:GldG family protein [Candidatus Roizmanbacteria bacterium]